MGSGSQFGPAPSWARDRALTPARRAGGARLLRAAGTVVGLLVLAASTVSASDELVLVETVPDAVWKESNASPGSVTGWVMSEGRYYQVRRPEPGASPLIRMPANWLKRGRFSGGAKPPHGGGEGPSETAGQDGSPGESAAGAGSARPAAGGDTPRGTGPVAAWMAGARASVAGSGLWKTWAEELMPYRGLSQVVLLATLFTSLAYLHMRRLRHRLVSPPAGAGRQAERPGDAADGLSGSLETVSLATVLQMLCSDRETGRLAVAGPGTTGESSLWIEEGRVRHADADGATGIEAAHRILRLRAGRFRFEAVETPLAEQTIDEDLVTLLIESQRRFDEAEAGRPEPESSVEPAVRPGPGLYRMRMRRPA